MIQTNAKKQEISTEIDIYSYGSLHRCACCSSGTLCRDSGAVMCNTETRKLVKMKWKHLPIGNLPSFES
jgi:uncharacterized protein YuzB (UPF0349 family)